MAGQVVVTGGAGCIGLAICRRILAAGQTPVALDLAAAIAAVDWDSAQARGIVPLAGDVTDRASIEAAARELSPPSRSAWSTAPACSRTPTSAGCPMPR